MYFVELSTRKPWSIEKDKKKKKGSLKRQQASELDSDISRGMESWDQEFNTWLKSLWKRQHTRISSNVSRETNSNNQKKML